MSKLSTASRRQTVATAGKASRLLDVRTLKTALALLSLWWCLPAPASVPEGDTAGTTSSASLDDASLQALEQGLKLMAEGDLENAIGHLEPLRDLAEPPPVALAALGALYVEIGLFEDALEILRPMADSVAAEPAVLYNASRAAFGQGEAALGKQWLERSVAAQPLSPAGRALGLRLGAAGQSARAFQLLQPWAAANPGDLEARLAAAVAGLALDRLDDAESLLAGLDGADPRVALLRGELQMQRRDPAATIALLEPLLDSDPAPQIPPAMQVDLLVLLSTAYLEIGQSAAAIARLKDQPGRHPRLALALSRAQYRGGDVAAALATLEPLAGRLSEIDSSTIEPGSRPLIASVAWQQGRLLVAADRAAEAVSFLQLASRLNPWSREIWQELARAHAAAGDPVAAQAALDELGKLGEARQQAAVPGLKGQARLDDPIAKRLAEAVEWSARGEHQKALDIVRQEISLAPDDLRPRLLEVRTLLAMGRNSEALPAVEDAVERFPDQPDALHFRAVVRMSEGAWEAAEGDLENVLAKAPQHVPAMTDLALLYATRGDREQARTWLLRVLELRPDDPLASARLQALDADR